MLIRLFPLLLVLSAATPAPGQQAVMSNDYWLSFLPSLDNSAPTWVLVSTLTEGTQVKVEYSDDGMTVDQFMVSPNNPKEYRMRMNTSGDPYQMAKPDQAGVVQHRSIHVTSNHPIAVQQFTDADNNVSLSLPIPTAFLGRKYVISAFNDQQPTLSPGYGSFGGWQVDTFPRTSGEYVIIAAQDSTVVTIHAVGKHTSGLLNGQSETITLKKGETYLGKGLADTSTNDISGTTLSSNHPIAVTAGCEIVRSWDGLRLQNHFDFNDHIAEYMIPVEQWGTEYIGGVLSNKKGTKEDDLWGDLYRVYAAEETELFMDGHSRGDGTYWEFALQSIPRSFTADKPIMVAQYDYYIDFHGINPKNPRTSNTMHMLLPRHQWSKDVTCMTPTGYAQTYYYVTAHRDSIDKIGVWLPGKVEPVPVSGLKYNGAAVYNIGVYRIYTLVLGVRGQIRFSGPCQFQVLNHGTRDNDAIKATYGYASVAGSTFGRMSSSDFLVQIDSGCGAFVLTVKDTSEAGDGLADIQLLHDPMRLYVSQNTKLTVNTHSIGAREITAQITMENALLDAYGAVMIRSRSGREKIVTVTYRAPKITVSESLDFANVRFGDTMSGEIEITNVNTIPITIDSVALGGLNPTPFRASSIDPVPHLLAPGEKHRVTVAYSPSDTGIVEWDSIVVVSDCIRESVRRVEGFGSVAIIFAEDQDFKVVAQGEMKSETLSLHNLSSYIPLVITGFEFSHPEFTIDPAELSRFPIELSTRDMPGSRAMVRFNYQPLDIGSDTAVVIWKTDIHPAFGDSNRKEWSVLSGQGSEARSVDRTEDKPVISVIGNELALNLQESEHVETIRITDILGKTRTYQEAGAVPLGQFESGVYFIEVMTNERRISQKIVR